MNTPDAPDPRKVAEAALEAFVYVPLGLALEAKDLLPKLAQRGRNQVVLARLGARFARQRAEAEAERFVQRFQQAATPPAAPSAPVSAPAAATEAPASAAADTTAADTAEPEAVGPAPARSARARTPRTPRAGASQPTPAASAAVEPLAIPGYDTLSASQVVPRLDALLPTELEAVRLHESAHRNRRTILSRIAQLQA